MLSQCDPQQLLRVRDALTAAMARRQASAPRRPPLASIVNLVQVCLGSSRCADARGCHFGLVRTRAHVQLPVYVLPITSFPNSTAVVGYIWIGIRPVRVLFRPALAQSDAEASRLWASRGGSQLSGKSVLRPHAQPARSRPRLAPASAAAEPQATRQPAPVRYVPLVSALAQCQQ